MSETKFTPGPWGAWAINGRVCVCPTESSDVPLAMIRTPWLWSGNNAYGAEAERSIQAANAALIAAAPDLYAVCSDIVTGESGDKHYKCAMCEEPSPSHSPACWIGNIRNKARAALAKARGEA